MPMGRVEISDLYSSFLSNFTIRPDNHSRMKQIFQSVTGLFLMTMAFDAHAVALSWGEVVRYAQSSNPNLEASKKDWLATRANESVALAGYLPTLSASTSMTKIGSRAGAGGVVSNGVVLNNSNASQVTTNYLGSLNGNFNIFNGFENKSRIDQAEWRSQNSYWTYVTTKSALSYSLKEAFSNLILAQESFDLAISIEERRESNHKLVSVRYDNGRENKGSVLLAEAYLDQAKLDVIKATDTLNVAQTKLKSLMNQDQFDKIEVTGEAPLEQLNFSNKTIEDLAVETPNYQQQKALEMVAKEEVSIAESNFMPNLDLSGNVTRQGETYFPDRGRERWSLALTLTIPIFDGLKDYSSRKGAVFSQYAAEGRKKNALLELIPKLKDAQNQAKQSDIKYSVDDKFRKAATSRAEIARAKYNNGLITFEDWDIIESDLIQRQTSFLQSKRDRTLKYATWENLLGRGAIE